jgi:soluble lytic murein transglycosylase-like protein
MGGAGHLLGGFATTLTSNLQQAQERRWNDEYKRAMIEQSKLQTKVLENKMQLEEMAQTRKQGLWDQLLGGGGLSGGQPPGAMPPAPPAPSPQAQPQIGRGGDDSIGLMMQAAAQRFGIPPGMLGAIMQAESGGDPRAVSPKGAQGLMQLMPGTAQEMGVSDPFNPEQNLMGGAGYFRQMLDKFGGDPRLALAAYNAGPGAVQKYGGIPPYRETQEYVERVMSQAGGDFPQQMAQAQMGPPPQAQADPFGGMDTRGLALDILMKEEFGLDPKIRERGGIKRSVDLGDKIGLLDEQGSVVKTIPKTVEPGHMDITDPFGAKTRVHYDRFRPPGRVQLEPGKAEKPPEIPSKINEYIATEIDPIDSQLGYLLESAQPEYFGMAARLKAEGLERIGISEGLRGLAKAGVINIPPGFMEWWKTLWRLQNKEISSFAGTQVTATELQRVLKQMPTANTPQEFEAGVMATKRAAAAYKQSVYDYYGQSEAERARQGDRPRLDSFQQKGPVKTPKTADEYLRGFLP